MFDSHPRLAVTHELQFIGRMAQRARRFERRDGFARERFLREVVAADSFHLLRLTEDEVRSAVREAAPADLASAVRALMAAYATKEGKERYADKTPGHVARIPLLAAMFPEARFIHILRDGRDSMLAYRDRGFGPQSVEEAALNWRTRVRRGRRDGLRLGPGRYAEVRYEDLVDDPEGELRRLCDFIDLDYDPAMLRFHERSEEILVGVRPSHVRVFESLSQPVTRGIRDWRSELTPGEVERFAVLAGDALAEVGYDPGVDRLPLRRRAAALAHRAAWARRRGTTLARSRARRAVKSLAS